MTESDIRRVLRELCDDLDRAARRVILPAALGAGMALKPGDVAARANFCTLGADGIVTDRRAGRIPSETCAKLVAMLKEKASRFEDVDVILEPGKGKMLVPQQDLRVRRQRPARRLEHEGQAPVVLLEQTDSCGDVIVRCRSRDHRLHEKQRARRRSQE